VLSALPIHLLLAINVPKWFIKAVNKIRRGFLWKGRQNVNGGCCLVAWDKVQRPLDLGGLGISNLELMGWALQVRWLWFRKTDRNRPWHALEIPTHHCVIAMFQIAMESRVGNGNTILFWRDNWLTGKSISEIAPLVVEAVPAKIKNKNQFLKLLLWWWKLYQPK
jgi:hypothetical protein